MKFIIDTTCELSPDLQYFYFLIQTGKLKEANQFETENSPFEGNPIESYKDKLIRLGYLVNSTTPNKLKKLKTSTVDELIDNIIPDYRAKFKNKKAGAIGDAKAIKNKFERFFKEYPEYADKELILDATQRYINTCARDNFKFLMQADYLIFKNNQDGGGSKSTLAAFCEEVLNLTYSNGKQSGDQGDDI